MDDFHPVAERSHLYRVSGAFFDDVGWTNIASALAVEEAVKSELVQNAFEPKLCELSILRRSQRASPKHAEQRLALGRFKIDRE